MKYLSWTLLVTLAVLTVGCEEELDISELRRVTVSDIYSSYSDIEGEKVVVSGFAVMSAQEYWILDGKGRTAFTPLGDTGYADAIVHLWWDDWTGTGFKESGEITAVCEVGSRARANEWVHSPSEIRLEDCFQHHEP